MTPRGDPPRWDDPDDDGPDDDFEESSYFSVESLIAAVQACLRSTSRGYSELDAYAHRLATLAHRLASTAEATNSHDLQEAYESVAETVRIVEVAKARLQEAHQSGTNYLNRL